MDDVRRHLEAIEHLVAVAAELRVELWLRGGWAMDFFLGEVTRDHNDIDWFALAGDAARLRDALVQQGFQDVTRASRQQIDLVRENVEHGIALVDRDQNGRATVAGGPFQGEAWPDGMLGKDTGTLLGVHARIISPAAQIEIKRMMPTWNPNLRRRQKDLEDIAAITRHLN